MISILFLRTMLLLLLPSLTSLLYCTTRILLSLLLLWHRLARKGSIDTVFVVRKAYGAEGCWRGSIINTVLCSPLLAPGLYFAPGRRARRRLGVGL